MSKSQCIFGLILLGISFCHLLTNKEQNLSSMSNHQQRLFAITYSSYSWIYYVFPIVICCVGGCFSLYNRHRRNQVLQQSSTQANMRLVDDDANTHQPYSNQPYSSTQAYSSNQNGEMFTSGQMNQPPPQLGPVCGLCKKPLEPINQNDPVNSAPMNIACNHVFHYGCISKYLISNNNCPMCGKVVDYSKNIDGEVPLAYDD